MRYDAIIFDLDGTLGNTLPPCLAAFHAAIEPLIGRSVSDAEIIATFGPSEEGTIRTLASAHFPLTGVGFCDLAGLCVALGG